MPWFEHRYHVDEASVSLIGERLKPQVIVPVVGDELQAFGTALDAAFHHFPRRVCVAGTGSHPQLVEQLLACRKTGLDPWRLPLHRWWALDRTPLIALYYRLHQGLEGEQVVDDFERLTCLWRDDLDVAHVDATVLDGCCLLVHPWTACAGKTQAAKVATLQRIVQYLHARCIATFPVSRRVQRSLMEEGDPIRGCYPGPAVVLPLPELLDDVPPM